MQFPVGRPASVAAVGSDRSRRAVALFASPQSWNIVRQPDSAMPAAAIRAGKHHAAWYTPLGCLKSATAGVTAGEKSAALLWKYC
jgi:hypothetical protein